jgi:hypothetical protein
MDRGDGTSKYMIIAPKNTESFNREHIQIILYDT